MSSFDRAVEHVRQHEGGLVEHPSDPGGRTNFGITQRTLDASREAFPDLQLPAQVDALEWSQAKEIYRRQYWQQIRGNELPPGIALAVLDAAVNCSAQRAIRWMQYAVGVKPDGWIGAQTLAAVRKCEPRGALREFHARRAQHFMLQDSTDDIFGLGWARRLMSTHDAASQDIQ